MRVEAEVNEKEGIPRPLLIPSQRPSFTEQAEGTAVLPSIRHTSEMEHNRWSPENIIHSTYSDLDNKFALGQENKEKPRMFPIWPRALVWLIRPCVGGVAFSGQIW